MLHTLSVVFVCCLVTSNLAAMHQKKKPIVPKIVIHAPPDSTNLGSSNTQATPRSPRISPQAHEVQLLARGDRALYQALISSDPNALSTFLKNARKTTAYALWFQDFVLTTEILSTPLTADTNGGQFYLIDTVIKLDTEKPIEGSTLHRTNHIFSIIHPTAQRDMRWITVAEQYRNDAALKFINAHYMSRDNSSFTSNESDSSYSPGNNSSADSDDSEHSSEYASENEYDSDQNIAELVEDAARNADAGIPQKIQDHTSIIPRILVGCCCILGITALIYLWLEDYATDCDDIDLEPGPEFNTPTESTTQ